MNHIEDYLFWKLAFFFIEKHGYRIVRLSQNHQELWLENQEHKNVQAIRLLRYDLAWSNWMARDIERVAHNGELIRKQLLMREITVLNLYLSPYGPVDDDSFLDKPFVYPGNKKARVVSKIIERQNYAEQLARLSEVFSGELNVSSGTQESYLEEADKLKRSALGAANERVREERSVFTYGKPFFTYFFMALQIIIFIVMEFSGGSKNPATLIDFGAKFNPLILEGEWWRFITPMFLHIGLLHLFMNSLALYYLGTLVERIYGNARFLLIYLIAGFGGAFASFLFTPNLSAGASGAIFGCFGALLYFGVTYPKLFFRTMGLNIIVILALNLSLGFTIPGIDNAGHIGGLIGGFLATGMVHFPKKRKLARQILFFWLILLAVIPPVYYSFNHPEKVIDEESVLVLSQYYFHKDEVEKAYQYMISSHLYEEGPSPQYLLMLADLELRTNRIESAEKHLLEYIRHEPDSPAAYYALAQIYEARGDRKNALDFLKKAVELDPDNQEYRQILDLLTGKRKLDM